MFSQCSLKSSDAVKGHYLLGSYGGAFSVLKNWSVDFEIGQRMTGKRRRWWIVHSTRRVSKLSKYQTYPCIRIIATTWVISSKFIVGNRPCLSDSFMGDDQLYPSYCHLQNAYSLLWGYGWVQDLAVDGQYLIMFLHSAISTNVG